MAKTQIGDILPEVGFAIFGLGKIGKIHLNNLRNNSKARILYCVEESEAAINFVRNWRLEETGTSFIKPSEEDKVFQDKRVDAVVICTPSFAHEELTIKSLESGKAVFCEKPLALYYEGIERCVKAAKKYQRPLMCGFNRRFDPGLRSLKERVDSGEIGKLVMVKTCSRDVKGMNPVEYLKTSGGIFFDCAVHDIDFVCWMVGEFPVSVSSFAESNFDEIKAIGDFDTVSIMMKFPGGALAVVDLSRLAVYGYDQRAEVFGTDGMITIGEQKPTELRAHSTEGTTSVPIFGGFSSRYREAYANELEHFINVVQGIEKYQGVPGSSILAVSKIASALEESARQGRTVTLDWDTNVSN